MKKLLLSMSLFSSGVVSVVPFLSVTSCATYDDFNKYINESKNKTVVVYISASDNASSKSFNKTLEEVTDTNSFDAAINKFNETKEFNDIEENSGEYMMSHFKNLGKSYDQLDSENKDNYHTLKSIDVEFSKSNWWKSENKKWRINNDHNYEQNAFNKESWTNEIVLRNLEIGKTENHWSNKDTKNILNNLIAESFAKTLYGARTSKEDDIISIDDITSSVNTITSNISSKSIPLFLVLRGGLVVGVQEGFATWDQFKNKNSDYKKGFKDSGLNDKDKKVVHLSAFKTWIDDLEIGLNNYRFEDLYKELIKDKKEDNKIFEKRTKGENGKNGSTKLIYGVKDKWEDWSWEKDSDK